MSNILEKRKLDWVGDKRYNLLSKDEIKTLHSYRTTYTLCKKRINKIDRAQRQLDIDKEGLKELKKDLNGMVENIDYLRDKLEFSCYVVPLKRKSGKVYYNLSVSRIGISSPRSIPLGLDDEIQKHLIEYYIDNPIILRKVKKNWISWMKMECKRPTRTGEERIIYEMITDVIISDPLNFRKHLINRHTLFPLKN
jgi:hypothetical protein